MELARVLVEEAGEMIINCVDCRHTLDLANAVRLPGDDEGEYCCYCCAEKALRYEIERAAWSYTGRMLEERARLLAEIQEANDII